ncbi:hypothetical protein [Marinibactrum halimedae]|uniref:Lipoprotein n=1 Tax=Marinibactrum halimedae TaxID=1444977 RepID=A0AA37T7N0_9GAMM|nr:hypothetical protein [Marinibactrum halimedae]MCD9458802.1 hypothetical protein [Marinibactrum halimedae]GLS25361.1 hypothetical protein GCM10007877_10750 [Marinibactrum halimedae]
MRCIVHTFILFTAIVAVGCSVHVPIDPHTERYSELQSFGAHSKAVVFIPEKTAQKTFSEQGILAVGPIHEWEVACGETLAQSAKHFLENYFMTVEVRHGYFDAHQCSDCALVVKPTIMDLEMDKVLMRASVDLKFDIHDSIGKKVLTLRAKGRSGVISADRLGLGVVSLAVPILSSFMASAVLSNSVEDAFAHAYSQFNDQMIVHVNEGALARNWLPQNMRNKVSYGRYEFAAERTMMDAGCEFPKDGLRLVRGGLEELYEAYCWQQEPFFVSCGGVGCEVVYSENGVESTTVVTAN